MSWTVYPLLFITALVVGMWITESRCSNRSLARKLYIAGILGGILGARFFHSFIYGFDSAGLSAYGFALGSVPTFSIYYYWLHREWKDTDFLDAVAPAIAFGIGLFRIGCFYAGCCFGSVCDLPWSVRYGADSHAFAYHLADRLILPMDQVTLSVHPVQLYESIVSFVGFVLILMISWKLKSPASPPSRTESGQNIRPPINQPDIAHHHQELRIQPYELFLGWIAYYGLWRILSVPLRAGSGHFLAIDQTVWAVSTALSIAIIILRRRGKQERNSTPNPNPFETNFGL